MSKLIIDLILSKYLCHLSATSPSKWHRLWLVLDIIVFASFEAITLVEFEYERSGVRKPESHHTVVVHTRQSLDHAPQDMLVGHKQYALASFKIFDLRHDNFIPIRLNSLSYHFQRFASRHIFVILLAQIFVEVVKPRMLVVLILDGRRWVVIWLPPKLNLLFTVDLGSFFFVKALERTVMSFVYFPIFINLRVFIQAHFFQDQIACLSSSVQHRCVSDVESVPQIFEVFTRIPWFLSTLLRQRHINPSRELATFIPSGFSMSNKHNLNSITFWFLSFRVVYFGNVNVLQARYLRLGLLRLLKEFRLRSLISRCVDGLGDVAEKSCGLGLLLHDLVLLIVKKIERNKGSFVNIRLQVSANVWYQLLWAGLLVWQVWKHADIRLWLDTKFAKIFARIELVMGQIFRVESCKFRILLRKVHL